METERFKKWPLILASASPRRRELLQLCQLPFQVAQADVDEETILQAALDQRSGGEQKEAGVKIISVGSANPQGAREAKGSSKRQAMIEATLALAQAKAATVAKVLGQPSVVIGADTVVLLEERVLGKPKSKEEAMDMLHALVGKKHWVITGVAIHSPVGPRWIPSVAEVHFHPEGPWTKGLIQDYVDSLSPMDKAGAYGIQDMGALLVEKIHGDYYTVMGFPVASVWRTLMDLYGGHAENHGLEAGVSRSGF